MKLRPQRHEFLRPAGVEVFLGVPAGCGNFGAYLAFVMKILASPGLVDVGFEDYSSGLKYKMWVLNT